MWLMVTFLVSELFFSNKSYVRFYFNYSKLEIPFSSIRFKELKTLT